MNAIVPRMDEPAVLWVGDDLQSHPETPPQAICIDAATVASWLATEVPAWLLAMRSRGVAVTCPTEAGPATRTVVRELRTIVAPRHAAALFELAEDADLPVLAIAISQFQPDHTPSFAEIAAMLAQDSDPAAPILARLAWALEHL